MLGQGSPVLRLVRHCANGTPPNLATATQLSALGLLVHLFVLIGLASFTLGQESARINSDSPAARPLQVEGTPISIRISWGGGDDVQWQGSIRYTGGPASNIRVLGLTQDTPGSVYLENGNVHIASPSPSAYGGVEVTVNYFPGTEVQAVFRNVASPDQLIRKTISIDEILKAAASRELDGSQNRLTIARSPGDWLKLNFSREHLVFQTGEIFPLQIEPTLSGMRDQRARCKATLVRARSKGSPLWTGELEFELDSEGSAMPQPLELPIPVQEGVYDLQLQLEPTTFSQRLSQAPRVRSLQFVALSPAPLESSGELWREQAVIDPTANRLGRGLQWSQLLRASGFRTSVLESQRTVIEHCGERLVQLEPDGWQAIGLRLNESDEPVLLEIEYLAEEGASLGFSVLQPMPNGQMPTYGFDSGVVVPKSFAIDNGNPELLRHQVMFWPSTTQPMLLVSNRSKTNSVKFGKIRVLTGPSRLAADRHLPDGGLKDRTRQFLAFYESPMFAENFGAAEIYEPAIDQTLDDWVTFYQGADRLIQYLKAHGYTGAVLTAAADSGAIYPSVHLGATPIFDSGVFFSSGQDPVQKDVLELLFRMFDREGLTLVPAFAFSGPIPALETRIRAEGPADYRPVNFRGQSSSLNNSHAAYSALNPEVQDQVSKIIDELTNRYTHHTSFHGVSLLCRPDTFTQLNGRRWGYNSPTVAQFLHESGGIQLTSGAREDWSAVQSLLLGSQQQRWLEWRADMISEWYKRLHSIVSDGGKGRRLYLSAIDIYRHPDIVSSLSPSLHWSNKFEEAMLELGWHPENMKDNPSIVLLKPNRVDENSSLASSKVETQMEHSQRVTDFFLQQAITGEIFTHQTQWARFADLQSPSAFKNLNEQVLRLQQLTPADWQNRKRFIASIRNLDSRLMLDGGWLLTMGQERSLIDLVDVFTQLPDLPFDTAESTLSELNAGPVVVRQAITDGRWYFYCLNDSPWEAEATLILNRGEMEKLESLSLNELQIEESDGKRKIRFRLPPYSLVGGFTEASGTQVVDYEFSVDENAAAKLKARLNQLQLRLIQATDVKPMEVIQNPSFEDSTDSPASWAFDQNRIADFEIVSSQGNALRMKSTQGSNWIRSQSFAVPETGRLSVSVWMRTDASEQPPLRIAVESESNGYYRFGSTGSLAPNDPSNQIGRDWRQYVVHFDDLPVNSHARLQVGFDLMGPGTILIDRVEVYDRLFDANDIQALTQRLAAARPLVDSPTDFDLCRRMLKGYWLRFLNDYIGEVESQDVAPGTQGELIVDQQPAIRTSSIFQRFRNMMAPKLKRR